MYVQGIQKKSEISKKLLCYSKNEFICSELYKICNLNFLQLVDAHLHT